MRRGRLSSNVLQKNMSTQTASNIGSTNNYALASLILSCAFVILGPFGSVPGIICGHLAIKDFRRAGVSEGRVMARAGIVIGWIGLVMFVISGLIALFWFHQMNHVYDSLNGLDKL